MKALAKDTAVYGLSSIIGRFLNYLLVPLYTAKLSAASGGYGIITEVYSYVALLLVLLTFGMETTFFRFVNKEEEEPMRVYSTTDAVTAQPSSQPNTGGAKYIYLTFDDGPCENTYRVLDILDRYNVKATFFTVGYFVDRRPEIVRRLGAEAMVSFFLGGLALGMILSPITYFLVRRLVLRYRRKW